MSRASPSTTRLNCGAAELGEVAGEPDVARAAPGRLNRGRVQVQPDGERVNVPRVAVHDQAQLRRAREMYPVERVGKFLQLRLPNGASGGFFAMKNVPVANLRRVDDVA